MASKKLRKLPIISKHLSIKISKKKKRMEENIQSIFQYFNYLENQYKNILLLYIRRMSYANFLKTHQTKFSVHTHTRIGDIDSQIYGGKFNIPDEHLENFWQLYANNLENGEMEYLTEKQNGNVIAIDLDFRYSIEVNNRRHTQCNIDNFCISFLEEIKKMCEYIDERFYVFVMEKPNINQVQDKNITKDGIHIIVTLKMSHKNQCDLRKKMLKNMPDIFEDLPLTNNWGSVYDEGIVKGTTNWNLYGSRKPQHEAYELTTAYLIEMDPNDNEFMMNKITDEIKQLPLKEQIKLLSVQNKNHKEYPIKETEKKAEAKPKAKPPIATNSTNKNNELEKLEYFLDNGFYELIKEKKRHEDLCKIGIALNTEFQDNGLSLFLKIAKNYSANYDEDEYKDKYEKLINKTDDPPKLATIYYIFKEYDENKYNELNQHFKNNYFIDINDLNDSYLTSNIIAPKLQKTLKCCNEEWYSLNKTTQLWSCQKNPHYMITTEIRQYIDYSNLQITNKIKNSVDDVEKDTLIKLSKLYLASYQKINSLSYLSLMIKYLTELLNERTFYQKLNVLEEQLAFQNGIYDLRTLKLRPIKWDDYLTETIPYDYIECDKTKTKQLKEYLKQILNNNDEHLEYFLSIIGFCFIGQPYKEKSLYCCLDGTDGRGDNGKTFYFDILTDLLPNYVYKSKGTLFEEGNSKVHKQLVNTKGKRAVWTDEYSKTKKPNAPLMKELADGLITENEIMYGTSEMINILFKTFILTNHIMPIDPEEQAIYNRYKQITYCSHFDRTGKRTKPNPEKLEFIADPHLSDKIKTQYYNEVFGLIIEYANNYIRIGKLPNIPEQFLNDTKKTKDINDEFGSWFNENCLIEKDGKIPLKLLVSVSQFSEKLTKEGMKRKGFKYNKDLSKMGQDIYGKAYKGGFEGVSLIKMEENEEEENKL